MLRRPAPPLLLPIAVLAALACASEPVSDASRRERIERATETVGDDPTVQAIMTAGSVAFWLGRTYHGAGENRSDSWRYGAIAGYTLGWLRSQQNQYVLVPREEVRAMPESLRSLVGYASHGQIGVADYNVI